MVAARSTITPLIVTMRTVWIRATPRETITTEVFR